MGIAGWMLGAVLVAALSGRPKALDAGAEFIEGGASTQAP
jgi:hypothetical protein